MKTYREGGLGEEEMDEAKEVGGSMVVSFYHSGSALGSSLGF